MKKALALTGLLILNGCAVTVPPGAYPITDEKREFTFDYAIPGKPQQELYRSARNYLATAYVDSRAVTRVEDEGDGTIIGKGVAPWAMTIDSAMIPSMPCTSNYDVIFIAKEGRARLQLTLKESTMPSTACNTSSPPKRDYPQIVRHFIEMSTGLEKALNGQGAVEKLSNF